MGAFPALRAGNRAIRSNKNACAFLFRFYPLRVFLLAGAFLAVFLSCGGEPSFREGGPRFLVVRNADTGRLYGKWPLWETKPEQGGAGKESAPRFSVEFVHSVNNSPVRETFAVGRDGSIGVVEARFYSFGAGMPSDLDGGLTLSRDGDALVLSGFADPGAGRPRSARRRLDYIVGTVSDHLLYINGETISLRGLCGRNAHIRIQGE
ncbi:MAG: DUF1850 domain-containing protein [Treponema sp.]|jgi:hypothetical protein|nr:DUF1850 domain-containing protein [Treponema sp.]